MKTLSLDPSLRLPSGPTTPALLQLLQWIGRPIEFMETCSQRYGDLFTARLGVVCNAVFVSHPDALQAVLKADPAQFKVGAANGLLRPLLGDESLLLLDGSRHQQHRQWLMPPFHGDRMRAYGDWICQITRQVAQQWAIAQPVPIRPAMQEISLRVILQAVFGLEQSDRLRQLEPLVSALLNATGSPLSSSLLFIPSLQKDWGAWSPWGQFLRQRSQVDEIVYSEIRQRRANYDPAQQDILTLLLAARDAEGQGMTDVELRDELMTLLLAGHETTASALSWALYWIHTTPGVLPQLLDELKSVADLGETGAIARLPYLNAVCQETLRIYPITVLTAPRVTQTEFELMGYRLAPGSVIFPCIYLTHRRPDLYPQPQQFRPERFLERQFSPYEFLPFGGSNRRCIGMAFALFEMKLVLATLLSQWRLKVTPNRPIKPIRRGVTMAPPNNLKLVVTA